MNRIAKILSQKAVLDFSRSSTNILFYKQGGLVKAGDYTPFQPYHYVPCAFISKSTSVVSSRRTLAWKSTKGTFNISGFMFNNAFHLNRRFVHDHGEPGGQEGADKYKDPHKPELVRWTPPTKGSVKLNCKGRHEMHGSTGGVLRDEKGRVIFAFHEFIGMADSILAELRALEKGIYLAREIGYERFEVELDCERLYELVTKKEPLADKELEEYRLRIVKALGNMTDQMRLISREENRLADGLAREGANDKGFKLYSAEDIENVPVIECLILRDQLGIPTIKMPKA